MEEGSRGAGAVDLKADTSAFAELVRARPIDGRAIAAALDAMSHAGRVAATRALARADMPRLFEAAGSRALALEDLVPAGVAPLAVARHVGTNNLPLFRAFEKPMYRDRAGRVCGRNAQTWEALTGPGYFTVSLREGGEALFDYTRLPTEAPPGWPRVRSNARGLSYFVFRDLQDVVRALSRDVVIGRATRMLEPLPQYFVLVREW